MRNPTALFILASALASATRGAPIVLEDFESLAGWRAVGGASFSKAKSAKIGRGAIYVAAPRYVSKQLISRIAVQDRSAWDRCQGVSFWVKGDGSDQFGSLSFGPRPYGSYLYVCYFPLKNTQWHKVTVPWCDLIPEGQYYPIGTPGALPPSGIKALRIGSRWTIWHRNAAIPRHNYCIDQVQLEERVPAPAPAPRPADFKLVAARLKAGKPVHIVCMGDSITAGTALVDPDRERYAAQMQVMLRQWLHNNRIVCESRGVGGAKLTDARAWAQRDFVGEPPDLVTILYGYNDKSAAFLKAYFKDSLRDYIDRVARFTRGRAAVLLLTTIPGTGPRFVMMDDFADAVREVASERGLPCCDLHKVFKALGRRQVRDYFADQAHPNAEGHRILARAIASFLARSVGVKPPPVQREPPPPPGQAQVWSFESGRDGWRLERPDVRLTSERAAAGRGAVHFDMRLPGRDHRRAWSPLLPAAPGQRYRLDADVFCAKRKNGGVALFACFYSDPKGETEPQIQRIQSVSFIVGRWEHLSNTFVVPRGAAAMRILAWAPRDAVAQYYVDEVKLTPRPPHSD